MAKTEVKEKDESLDEFVERVGLERATYLQIQRRDQRSNQWRMKGRIDPGFEDPDQIQEYLENKFCNQGGEFKVQRYYTNKRKYDEPPMTFYVEPPHVDDGDGSGGDGRSYNDYFKRDPKTGELQTEKILAKKEKLEEMKLTEEELKLQQRLEKIQQGEFVDEDDFDEDPVDVESLLRAERTASENEILRQQLAQMQKKFEEERRQREMTRLESQMTSLQETVRQLATGGFGGPRNDQLEELRKEHERTKEMMREQREQERLEWEKERRRQQEEAHKREMEEIRRMYDQKIESIKDSVRQRPKLSEEIGPFIPVVQEFVKKAGDKGDMMAPLVSLMTHYLSTQQESQKTAMETMLPAFMTMFEVYSQSQAVDDDPMSFAKKALNQIMSLAKSQPQAGAAPAIGSGMTSPGAVGIQAQVSQLKQTYPQFQAYLASNPQMEQMIYANPQVLPQVVAKLQAQGPQQVAGSQAPVGATAPQPGTSPVANAKTPVDDFIQACIQGVRAQDDNYPWYIGYAERVLPERVIDRMARCESAQDMLGLIVGYAHSDVSDFQTRYGMYWLEGFLDALGEQYEYDFGGDDDNDTFEALSTPGFTNEGQLGGMAISDLKAMGEKILGKGAITPEMMAEVQNQLSQAQTPSSNAPKAPSSAIPKGKNNGPIPLNEGDPVPVQGSGKTYTVPGMTTEYGEDLTDLEVEDSDEKTLAKRKAAQQAAEAEMNAKDWLLNKSSKTPKSVKDAVIYSTTIKDARKKVAAEHPDDLDEFDEWVSKAFEATGGVVPQG